MPDTASALTGEQRALLKRAWAATSQHPLALRRGEHDVLDQLNRLGLTRRVRHGCVLTDCGHKIAATLMRAGWPTTAETPS